MKIAVLAHSFPRFRGDTHGTFVKSLCEAIAGLGHQVFVLVPFDVELRNDPDSALEVRSFRYFWPDHQHLLGYSRTLRRDVAMRRWAWIQSPFYFLFAQRALKKLVQEESIDLVHAHWHLPNGYVAWRVSRQTGVPFAVTLHGSDVFMAERNGLFRSMAKGALGGASHVTSCSADLRNRLLTIGGNAEPDKVILLPNGTELEVSGQQPSRVSDTNPRQSLLGLDLDPDDRLVAAVGRMVDKKGFRFLLDAMPRVLAAEPKTRLILGGGGDLLDSLRARAQELGITDRVLFPGGLSHPQVLELLEAAELFVMPSIRDEKGNVDGLPIVVLEAMAAGRPVVASDLAGMPLAVDHGETGFLVPEKQPQALAEAISQVLANPEEGRRLGAAGKEKVRLELNWNAVAKQHDKLYQRAAAG